MATSGMLTTQFDYSKLFIWANRFKTATYTNGTGSTVTLAKGTLMGRIHSSNKVAPCVSTATDGSQVPIGVLAADYSVANAASATVSFCIAGDVAREGVIFGGSDTYATLIVMNTAAAAADPAQIGTIEDILNGRGIITVATTENTFADNA